jgi:single-strand DNA-binding protein
MTTFNSVVLLGNLTRDPELRYTPQGVPLCSFVVAINGRATSSEEEPVSYVDVQAWRHQAEVCAQFLKKGCQVLVVGELKQDRWVDTSTKIPRSKLLVVAREVKFTRTRGVNKVDSPAEPAIES